MTIFLVCLLLGGVTGLRSFMGPALVCWAAHFGWFHFTGTRLEVLDHRVILLVFTLLAIAELIADKLPKTPARTAPPGLIVRLILGALCGVAVTTSAHANTIVGAILGAAGALGGAFGGYHIRRAAVQRSHAPDFVIALVEDVVAIAGGLLIVSRL